MTKHTIPYLDRLQGELVRVLTTRQEQEARHGKRAVPSPVPLWGRSRRTWAVAGTAAALITAAAIVGWAVLGPSGSSPRSAATGPGNETSPPLGAAGRCVEQFTPETLAHRDFAFDGTVTQVSAPEPEDAYNPNPTMVTFDVIHWYRGGSGATITLRTYERPGLVSSVGDGSFLTVGKRLLASGNQDFLWSCGFTMEYSPQDAELFASTFGE